MEQQTSPQKDLHGLIKAVHGVRYQVQDAVGSIPSVLVSR